MRYLTVFAIMAFLLTVQSAEKQKITISMDTPSTAWTVMIQEVYQTDKELVVLSRLKSAGIGGAAISRVSDSITVSAAKLPVKHYVLGKNWNWPNKGFHFIMDRKDFDKAVKGGKLLYRMDKKAK